MASRKFLGIFTTLVALSSLSSWSHAANDAKALPAPPRYYVLDEPKVLSPNTKRALQTLLIEHDRVTGEQVIFAIFESLGEEDLVDWTNQVFTKWGIGKRGKDNGVLLALYWENRKARIEVGYGLEPLLTDAKSKDVLDHFLIPELKNKNPDRALTLAALEILRILESPLVESGQAEQILRSGGIRGEFVPESGNGSGWAVWVILGIILLFVVLNLLTAADAHFSGTGWHRKRPSLPRRPRDIFGGWHTGGAWGGGTWGGGRGGGFIGGGGMSGGGGASGDW